MEQKTIFIAVYRGFSLRYIVESEVFRTLQRMPVRIVILHPACDLEYMTSTFSEDNVELEPFPREEALRMAKKNRLGQLFTQVRYLTYAGQSEGARGTRRIFEDYNFSGLRSRLTGLLARVCRASKLARSLLGWLEALFFSGREAEALFDKYRPEMLITSSVGYAFDCPIMRQAKRRGCRVMSVVHSWDNPSTKGYRGADPDYVVAWNQNMKDELVRYHDIAPEQIFVGGVAHWDTYHRPEERCSREEFSERHGIVLGKRLIFYAPTGFKHIPTTLDEVEYLLESIREDRFGEPCHLIFRMHPTYFSKESPKWAGKVKADLARAAALAEEYSDCSTFNYPEVVQLGNEVAYPIADLHRYADILHYSDVMVTEYSTCMIEACIFDLPVVNVAYQQWRDSGLKTSETLHFLDHLRRIFDTGAVRHAHSRKELLESIRGYLADRALGAAERRALVEDGYVVNRGEVGRKIADHVMGLISGG